MALSYIYIIQYTPSEYHGEIAWSGTQKWRAIDFLKGELEDGLSMDLFKLTRMKDGQPHTRTELDPYEFMQIDLGEVL